MTTNLSRFEADLDRLISDSALLEFAMIREIDEKAFEGQVKKLFKTKAEIDEFVAGVPSFNRAYEAWYSEALTLLKQLLPDRVANFVSHYEKPKSRKDITYANYVIQDFMQGLHVRYAGELKAGPAAALPQYRQQYAILEAAKVRFKSSLFEIKQLVQADMLDSEIDAARTLAKGGFYRAAGAIAGVILEKHLRQVCTDHGIAISKKNPGIADLNELLKAAGTIEIAQWRHISLLADLRNLSVHNKEQEPSAPQVQDLVDGTDKIIKTIF